MRNYYVSGDWNAICDRCGLRHKASQLKEEWTGLMVCHFCWETRHPQTLLRVPHENVATPWARPEPTDVFVDVSYPLQTEATDIIYTESGIILNTEG